jgi:phage-related protein
MPETRVVFYKDDDGTAPALDWIGELTPKVQVKCLARIKRLKQRGYELRRPEADYLRDGIYELRIRLQRVNYRMLYFFHGKANVVMSHGLVKEGKVPPKEIDRAIERREKFARAPEQHTYIEEVE